MHACTCMTIYIIYVICCAELNFGVGDFVILEEFCPGIRPWEILTVGFGTGDFVLHSISNTVSKMWNSEMSLCNVDVRVHLLANVCTSATKSYHEQEICIPDFNHIVIDL